MSLSTETALTTRLSGVRPRVFPLPQTVILSAAKDPRESSLRSSAWMRMSLRSVIRSAQNDGTAINSGFLRP
jgi:hypothetical protein